VWSKLNEATKKWDNNKIRRKDKQHKIKNMVKLFIQFGQNDLLWGESSSPFHYQTKYLNYKKFSIELQELD
jgi:hypothetical protein